MEKDTFHFTLQRLTESQRRLKASLEWLTTKGTEHRLGEPPVMTMNPELAADIRYQQGIFWRSVTDILGVLNRGEPKGVSKDKRERWRQEVLRMKAEMESLTLPKTF